MNRALFGFCLLLALSLPAAAAPRPHLVREAPASPSRVSIIDNSQVIDANAIRMFVTNTGSFAWDKTTGNAGLEFPRGSGNTAVFASGLWLGGLVGGELRVALSEYSDEFGPGSA